MIDINDELRNTAALGDKASVKALLLNPECDDLAQTSSGETALMWAAYGEDAYCVEFLLPVSDALAKTGDALTASRNGSTPYPTSLTPAPWQ